MCLFLFYFILSHFYSFGDCSFLIRDRKGVDPEERGSGEELGGKRNCNQDITFKKNLTFQLKGELLLISGKSHHVSVYVCSLPRPGGIVFHSLS